MGVDVSFSQPYRPQSNALCERTNDEYEEELRILRQSIETSNWVPLNDYVVICMNHKQRGKSGYLRGDVFYGRPTLRLDLPFPNEGNVQVQDWVKEQNKIAQVVWAHLRKGRASWFKRVNRRRKPAVCNVGDYVLVSRKRFKQLEVPKGATKDVMWYGPYLVTQVSSGGITAHCSPTEAVAAGSPYRYPLWLARALNGAIYDVKWDYEGYRTIARIAAFYVKIAVFYNKFMLLCPIL